MAQAAPGFVTAPFRTLERISVWMACAGGAVLTALAFFVAIDVVGRGTSAFYSGATDEIAGFAMCLAVTWSLAYTLTIDKHVRVDLLLGAVSRGVRRVLDALALFALTVFAALLAINSWGMALESAEFEAFSQSILQIPLVIPQGAMAAGFTMLTLQAWFTFLVAVLDPTGLERAREAEGAAAPAQFDV